MSDDGRSTKPFAKGEVYVTDSSELVFTFPTPIVFTAIDVQLNQGRVVQLRRFKANGEALKKIVSSTIV